MTDVSGSTKLVGLLRWPARHSLSPRMQNAAFAALDLDWAYVELPTPPDRLEEAVRMLAARGFAGANVTTPHKRAVTAFCTTDVPSVNTLVVRDTRIEGWTTDAAILAGLVILVGVASLALVAGFEPVSEFDAEEETDGRERARHRLERQHALRPRAGVELVEGAGRHVAHAGAAPAPSDGLER